MARDESQLISYEVLSHLFLFSEYLHYNLIIAALELPYRAEDVVQWHSVCLEYLKHWVQSLAPRTTKQDSIYLESQ